jgi:hypothetical protein
MNKILFFSNQGLAPLHLGIELEVLSNLVKEKYKEFVNIICNDALQRFKFNLFLKF